jgi:transcriptional regulator GlxA family with amidase domain
MDARYCETIDVASVAVAVGLSRGHFIRQFHQLFGETPRQYLIGLRMQRAAALLATTDRAVGEICRAIGWCSVGSFTTRFTRTYGLSPTAYRSTRGPTTHDELSAAPAAAVQEVPGALRRG